MSRRFHTLIAAVACAVGVAACDEQLESGAGCPALCPQVPIELEEATIEAVVLDSTFGGQPALGFEEFPLLANRGDTLETRVILRFDSLPSKYVPRVARDDSSIVSVDSATLDVRLVFPVPDSLVSMTIHAYDVDTVLPPTSAADTMVATLLPLFRPDRLLGSVDFRPSRLQDSTLKGDSTVRIPIDGAKLLAKIRNGERLRIGLRLESTQSASVRLAGQGAPSQLSLRFRADPDTLVAPLVVLVRSKTPTVGFLAPALADYEIVVRGAPLPTDGTLAVGGVPGSRTYLRFEIPRRITDSSRVVRAALLLTQRANPLSANRGDTVLLTPDVLLTSENITNLEQAIRFTSRTFGYRGGLAAVPSLALVPEDEGEQVLEMATLISAWSSVREDEMPRVLVLRAEYPGRVGGTLLFHSREAAASLRPRLRLTYAPRLEFGLP